MFHWMFSKKAIPSTLDIELADSREIKAAEIQTTIGGSKVCDQKFIPPDYPVTSLANIITNPQRKIGYIPLALRVIYCILWHLDRRLKDLERK